MKKALLSLAIAATTLSACADYAITSRANGSSTMSNGAGYDLGMLRYGSGDELTYAEISDACRKAALQNGIVGGLLFAPAIGSFVASGTTATLLNAASLVGTSYVVNRTGYKKCMGMNFGIAIAPVDDGGFGFRVNNDKELAIWNSLTEEQRIRAAKFVEAGGTIQSALQPDI